MKRARMRAVYDDIAAHFAQTRHSPWPEVTAFLETVTGSRGLAVGCGNGRHLTSLAEQVDTAIGIDLSRELLTIAADGARTAPNTALFVGDAAELPLAENTIDVGLYVATIHHLPTRALRVASLDELARVLSPGGRGLVSAWSTAHDRFDQESGFDTTIDWTLPTDETVPRYYHIYAPDEFRADIERSNCTLTRLQISSGNCYAELKASA